MNIRNLKKKTKKELIQFADSKGIKINPSALKSKIMETITLSLREESTASSNIKREPVLPKKTGVKGDSKTVKKDEAAIPVNGAAMQKWDENIEKAKYIVYPADSYNVVSKKESLPLNYGDSKIVLMVRDPYWLHSYWEIAENRIQEGLKNLGINNIADTTSILRVYNITDIGFNGNNAKSYFDIPLSGDAQNWYIHAGNPNNSFVVDIGLIDKSGNFYTLARSNSITTPRSGISELVDEEWMTIEPDYSKIYALSGGLKRGADSVELKELIENQFQEQFQEEISSGGISSFGSGQLHEKKRGFWFVLDTELIVYGATDPGATVTLQGKKLPLRADGTFTVRFALPDGKQIIPVTAKSPDGVEERTIIPTVSRNTDLSANSSG